MRERVLPRGAEQHPLLRRLRARSASPSLTARCPAASATASATTPRASSPSRRRGTRRSCSPPGASAPALAAGNTVVLKPPEWAPLTCSMLGDLAERGGAAGRACSTSCTGAERGAGAPLTGHRGRRPRRVHRLAGDGAHRLPRRGGGAHARLLRARRQVAVPRLRRLRPGRRRGRRPPTSTTTPGRSALPGRACSWRQAVLEPFLARLRERVAAIVVGDPRAAADHLRPADPPGRARARHARAWRARVEQGAHAALRRRAARTASTTRRRSSPTCRRRPRSCAPRCSARCSRSSPSPTRPRRSRWPTATDYGLAATVFTGSRERSERVGGRSSPARCGSTASTCATSRPRSAARATPGIGREGGRHSFDFYCDVKTVCERTSAFDH